MKDIESEPMANIPTDHASISIKIQVRLKATVKVNRMRMKYEKCTVQDKHDMNKKVGESTWHTSCYQQMTDDLRKLTEENLPKFIARREKRGISEHLLRLISDRKLALATLNIERCKEIDKEVQATRRRERRDHIRNSVAKDLDLRDRWTGIRNMRKEYKPIP